MPTTSSLEALIANALKISEAEVTDELSYQSISAWDSLRHVELMLALEAQYGIEIEHDLVLALTSVSAIREYIQQQSSTEKAGQVKREVQQEKEETDQEGDRGQIYRGLNSIYIDRSRITCLDTKAQNILYRGYSIHDMAKYSTFEETAYLLLYGKLPTLSELTAFDAELKAARTLPAPIVDILYCVKDAPSIEALRTAVSALATFDPERDDDSIEAIRRKGIRLAAQLPLIVTTHYAASIGRERITPDMNLGHAANFLYMLTGKAPTDHAAEHLDKDFVIHAEHSSTPSTFIARAVAGTRANLHAAVAAAISAMSGPLHGGAVEYAMAMLREIGKPENASEYVRRLRAEDKPVMGFGHRVWRKEDPRVRHLRERARDLSVELGELKWYTILEALVEAMRPYARHGLNVNADPYAAIIYHLLGIPQELFISIPVISRIFGLVAHVVEQFENNILLRPLLYYVGEMDCSYVPIEQRQ